jgi:predicted SnoaL-like aldol condensation-catalyzing enzyme
MSDHDQTSRNKKLVIEALTGVFVRRDAESVSELFRPDYRQHNPMIPDGSASLPVLISSLSPEFKYEMGAVAAEGDLVMVHGRYIAWGPKPMVAVDIFRVENGKLAEHWDVMQEEVPAAQTKSGHPMFERTGDVDAAR